MEKMKNIIMRLIAAQVLLENYSIEECPHRKEAIDYIEKALEVLMDRDRMRGKL